MATFEGEVRGLIYKLPIVIRVPRTAQLGDQTPEALLGEEMAWAKVIQSATQRERGVGLTMSRSFTIAVPV